MKLGSFVERLKRLKGPLAAIAAGGAILSGLVGYYTTYKTVAGAGAAATAASAEPGVHPLSLLVLPFSNQTGDPSKAYIAEALTTAIATDLTRIRDAQILPVTTSLMLQGRNLTAQQAGKEAHTRFVLSGNVLASGDTLRIGAQLLDTLTGALVWSDTFEGSSGNLFALQDQFTTRVQHGIGYEMVLRAARVSDKRITNEAAGDLLLRARSLAYIRVDKAENWQAAEKAFRAVLKVDPQNAFAMAGLARVVARIGSANKANQAEATRLARQALDLDPELPDAYAALAFVATGRGDDATAREMMEKRLALAPRDPQVRAGLADACSNVEDHAAALRHGEVGLALDPTHPIDQLLRVVATMHFRLGHYTEAIPWLLKACAANAQYCKDYGPELAMAYAMSSQPDKAAQVVTELKTLWPGLSGQQALAVSDTDSQKQRQYVQEELAPAWRRALLPP